MAAVCTGIYAAGVSSGATVATVSAPTLNAANVYVAKITNKRTGGASAVSSLVGGGAVWTLVDTVTNGTVRVTEYWGYAASPTGGEITASFGGVTQDGGSIIHIEEWTGADTTSQGINKDTSIVTAGTTVSGTLSAITAGNGVSMAIALDGSTGGYTPGTDMILTQSNSSGLGLSGASFHTMQPQAAPSASWVNNRTGALSCFEVKAAGAPGNPKGTSTGSTTVVSSSFDAPSSGRAIIVTAMIRASGSTETPTLGGMSGTYTLIGAISNQANHRLNTFEVTGLTGSGQITATYGSATDSAAIYVYPLDNPHLTDFVGGNGTTADAGASDANVAMSITLQGAPSHKTIGAVLIYGAVTNFAWSGSESLVADDYLTPHANLTLAVASFAGGEANLSATWTTSRFKVAAMVEVLPAAAGGGSGAVAYLVRRGS
jgi:hypothetical protein